MQRVLTVNAGERLWELTSWLGASERSRGGRGFRNAAVALAVTVLLRVVLEVVFAERAPTYMVFLAPVLAASLHDACLVGDGFGKLIGDVFHMWYIFGTGWKKFAADEAPDRIYKIGHAVSSDGINWVKEEARQIIADRLGADESQALPTVVEIDGRHHMFFCYRQSSDFRKNRERAYRIGHA